MIETGTVSSKYISPFLSLCLSRSWGHPNPVHHWAQNQQTASAEQTAGSLCHSWDTCWSVQPQNNKQRRHWYEPFTQKTYATCKTCNLNLTQTESERGPIFFSTCQYWCCAVPSLHAGRDTLWGSIGWRDFHLVRGYFYSGYQMWRNLWSHAEHTGIQKKTSFFLWYYKIQ